MEARLLRILAIMAFILPIVHAVPSISSVSGTIGEAQTLTITGTGFGSKTQAAPLVWDDASTGSVPSDNGKWTDAWPNMADSSAFYARYTAPIRNVPLPHNHNTRYIAGGHGDVGWTLTVDLHKTYKINAYPQPVFISYYMYVDDAWNFCSGDNNFKLGSHSMPNGPYYEPYWYYEHRNPDFTATSTPGIITPYIPSSSGDSHTFLSGNAANPFGKWVKIEYEASYTNQQSGYVKIWSDGRLGTIYEGPTDAGNPGERTDSIGGYARCNGYPDNWRYFTDIYMDTALNRIMLVDNKNLANAVVKEMQIPIAWSDSSISLTVNLGKFQPGQTAYLFIIDDKGMTSDGYRVIIAGQGSSYCGDRICTSWENCSTCPADCGECACTPDWACSTWSACASGQQFRMCTDSHGCGISAGKPAESQACSGTCPTKFLVGGLVKSTTTLNVRSGPGSDYPLFSTRAIGDAGKVLEGPSGAECFYMIDYDTGTDGWSFGDYLETCTSAWQCDAWSSCSEGNQTRTCTDTNCGQANKAEVLACALPCISDAEIPPCDGCISQVELLQYITKWKSGQVTLANLMEAIRIWKKGC